MFAPAICSHRSRGNGIFQNWMRHRGFSARRIRIGPLAACWVDFASIFSHLLTIHTGESLVQFLITPQRGGQRNMRNWNSPKTGICSLLSWICHKIVAIFLPFILGAFHPHSFSSVRSRMINDEHLLNLACANTSLGCTPFPLLIQDFWEIHVVFLIRIGAELYPLSRSTNPIKTPASGPSNTIQGSSMNLHFYLWLSSASSMITTK